MKKRHILEWHVLLPFMIFVSIRKIVMGSKGEEKSERKFFRLTTNYVLAGEDDGRRESWNLVLFL